MGLDWLSSTLQTKHTKAKPQPTQKPWRSPRPVMRPRYAPTLLLDLLWKSLWARTLLARCAGRHAISVLVYADLPSRQWGTSLLRACGACIVRLQANRKRYAKEFIVQ